MLDVNECPIIGVVLHSFIPMLSYKFLISYLVFTIKKLPSLRHMGGTCLFSPSEKCCFLDCGSKKMRNKTSKVLFMKYCTAVNCSFLRCILGKSFEHWAAKWYNLKRLG